MATLVSGLSGAVVISIYSTELDQSSFLVPRTVPATAVIFSEPEISVPRTTISRNSFFATSKRPTFACNRPILPLGPKINALNNAATSIFDHYVAKPISEPNHLLLKQASPFINRAYNRWASVANNVSNAFTFVQQRVSMMKAAFYEKLGVSCLVPRLVKEALAHINSSIQLRKDDISSSIF